MDVVILLAGRGVRLGKLTKEIPKPMLDINGKPFLFYLVNLMRKQGFRDFVFITSFKHEVIENYFKDGEDFGINIKYSIQDKPYGTGGNLVTALDKIESQEFLVLNGDTIFNIDFNLFIQKHKENNSKNSIALKKISYPGRYGIVEVDDKNKITKFSEKKRIEGEALINGGAYILNKSDFCNFEKKTFISLEENIFPNLDLKGFEMGGKFIDIGTLDSYKEFCNNPYKYIQFSGENKKIIRGRVPVRISFGGGGTDVSPYTEKHGGVALNVTIDKYIFASLKPREDEKIILISGNMNKSRVYDSVEKIKITEEFGLLESVSKKYGKKGSGFELYVYSEVPISSGVGGSAAAFVLLISLFNNFNKSISKDGYEIAEEAYKFEREDLKNPGGRQDQYAAVFGGLNFMEFNKEDFVKVNKLNLNIDILSELETNTLLFYVGKRERSGIIQKGVRNIIIEQTQNIEREKEALEAMHRTKQLALEMKRALVEGNLDEFGRKIDESWEEKKKFSKMITNKRIDNIYNEFKKLGALGGKITGAGGGGHMIVYAPLETHHKIIKKAKELKIIPVPFKFTDKGVELWTIGGIDYS